MMENEKRYLPHDKFLSRYDYKLINIRKYTEEDKFARKYYCNAYRFVKKMKRKNRKDFRRKLKIILAKNKEVCYTIEEMGETI